MRGFISEANGSIIGNILYHNILVNQGINSVISLLQGENLSF